MTTRNTKTKLLIGASLLTAVLAAGCTSQSDAQRALSNAGYTDIQAGGYDWFACGKDDFYSTKFTAKNPAGQPVNGVVCSGLLFKSATIRF